MVFPVVFDPLLVAWAPVVDLVAGLLANPEPHTLSLWTRLVCVKHTPTTNKRWFCHFVHMARVATNIDASIGGVA